MLTGCQTDKSAVHPSDLRDPGQTCHDYKPQKKAECPQHHFPQCRVTVLKVTHDIHYPKKKAGIRKKPINYYAQNTSAKSPAILSNEYVL